MRDAYKLTVIHWCTSKTRLMLLNISTKPGQQEEGYLNLIYDRPAERVRERDQRKGKNKFSFAKKKKVRINKNTTRSTVQGEDQLSQIKRRGTREEYVGRVIGGTGGGRSRYIQCTFIQDLFRVSRREHRESENRHGGRRTI